MNDNLIFDLGFHVGKDSENYTSKGYSVIAVEANPYLCNKVIDNCIIINKAIIPADLFDFSFKEVSFFVRSDKPDWSSCSEEIANQQNGNSIQVTVPATTLFDLVYQYGVPYYIKTDVEGCDLAVAKQLSQLTEKPQFVSFELNKKDYFDIFYYLKLSGYTKFQLRNQANNEEFSSGDFGKYLPEDKWVSFDEALSRYVKFRELRDADYDNLSNGWLDIHASL
jgi:FkbM family methyltransferase